MDVVHGNFLKNPDTFDCSFFRISPREAQNMDPQQRLLLRVAYNALEDAGYLPDSTPSSDPNTFGTYVGAATNDYVHNLRNDIDVYYTTGTIHSFLAGKLAYAFGFGGPSMVLDTACSSSLVAIHQACRALQAGDCNAALAGGVNVITSPDMYLGLARGHFLSPTGQCRPWDQSADGYCRAEGCGLFVLKRLEDAVADNDRIRAVIRGVEVNQSGNARSITHPHVPSQIALFKRVLTAARVDPLDLNVVECHGTGTQAGDPAEAEAIRAVLAMDRPRDNSLHVTFVKGNIGHCEAASGAASLAKLLLMLREQTIPRHVSFQQLSPAIPDLSVNNILIDLENTPWRQVENRPRTALLSNFGASGSNAALVLQEYVPVAPHSTSRDYSRSSSTFVVALSCRTADAAEKRRRAYLDHLKATADHPAALESFAYSCTARRQLHSYRIAVSGRTQEDILRALSTAPVRIASEADRVVFVFSGQGQQYAGVGAELYRSIPFITQLVDNCAETLHDWGYAGFRDLFVDPNSKTQQQGLLESTLFVLQYALAKLWVSWGLEPCALIGHSFGEFAALALAGVLTLRDALKLVVARARLVTSLCEPGKTSMASIAISADKLASLLVAFPDITVCCYNSASLFTVGGPYEDINAFSGVCQAQAIRCVILDIPYASHSAAMDPILDGALVEPGDNSTFTSEYFSRHAREPVKFQQAALALRSSIDLSTVAAFIEIGSHTSTLPLLRDIQHLHTTSQQMEPLALPSMRRGASAFDVLCASLVQLYRTAAPIRWRCVYADLTPHAQLVDLPAYPFEQTRFWVPYQERPTSHESLASQGLGDSERSERSDRAFGDVLDIPLRTFAELIEGHQIVGTPLCPASVYAELVHAAGKSSAGAFDSTSPFDLVAVEFTTPLVYLQNRDAKIRADISSLPSDHKQKASFTVSTVNAPNLTQAHCTGYLKTVSLARRARKLLSVRAVLDSRIRELALSKPSGFQKFSTEDVYDNLFPPFVVYSPQYRTIQTLVVDASSPFPAAYAVTQIPTGNQPHMRSPIFVDTLFHVAGFLANLTHGMNGRDALICDSVDAVCFPEDEVEGAARAAVYAHIVDASGRGVLVDVYAMAIDDEKAPGQIIARLQRVHFVNVAVASLQRAFATAAQPPDSTPQASSVETFAFTAESANSVRENVFQILADTAGLPRAAIAPNARLAHLGIDSLMLWEVSACLRKLLPTDARELSPRSLADSETVTDIVRLVEEAQARSKCSLPAVDSGIVLCDANVGTEGGSPPGIEEARTEDRDSPPSALSSGPELVRLQHGPAHARTLVLVHDGSGLLGLTSGSRPSAATSGPSGTRTSPPPPHEGGTIVAMAASYARLLLDELRRDEKRSVTASSAPRPFPDPRARHALPDGAIDTLAPAVRSPAAHAAAARAFATYDPGFSPVPSELRLDGVPAVVFRSRDAAEQVLSGQPSEPLRPFFAGCGGDLDGDVNVMQWKRLLGGGVLAKDIPGDHFSAMSEGNIIMVADALKDIVSRT
ncbi:uncharacterized protein BXZ73DRAFT_75212 [Epithele typhae]|uniref:uncharacterized protein n=1 Tax=Epithele typhae TaxID=378194 RepID=UPI00200731F6|nr:uncharacterized protein BXZ73DRAFT_75212 [Epithele typhae]KAH9941254.1 hypothetical protein BXZ73DRAFT_75212 [Epithele typhae]